MRYNDQLVLTGALNDVGSPIFTNSGKSYRFGFEAEATIAITEKLFLNPNATLSQNKNQDFYFQRDGVLTNLGNTNIAFSPEIVGGGNINWTVVNSVEDRIWSHGTTIGDINGDGLLDVGAAPNTGQNTLKLHTQESDGTFINNDNFLFRIDRIALDASFDCIVVLKAACSFLRPSSKVVSFSL